MRCYLDAVSWELVEMEVSKDDILVMEFGERCVSEFLRGKWSVVRYILDYG